MVSNVILLLYLFLCKIQFNFWWMLKQLVVAKLKPDLRTSSWLSVLPEKQVHVGRSFLIACFFNGKIYIAWKTQAEKLYLVNSITSVVVNGLFYLIQLPFPPTCYIFFLYIGRLHSLPFSRAVSSENALNSFYFQFFNFIPALFCYCVHELIFYLWTIECTLIKKLRVVFLILPHWLAFLLLNF